MKYVVSPTIEVEANADNTSVTGKVNGVPVAVVLNTRALPKAKAARRKVFDEALVDALLAKGQPSDKPEALAHVVER